MSSHNLSLRQRVRFSVPSFFLIDSSSVDQGALLENHDNSSWRASSHVMPESIAFDSGHLTQNHVLSSFSPRIKGNQFSSSVAGIRSGLVNTPVKSHHLLPLTEYIPDNIPTVLSPRGSYCRASRCAPWFTKSAASPYQREASSPKQNVLSQATVSRIMQVGFSMYDIARSCISCISRSSPPTKRPKWSVKDSSWE
jgi:hypothetical protein